MTVIFKAGTMTPTKTVACTLMLLPMLLAEAHVHVPIRGTFTW
jgi:hypothetical protein